MENMRSREKDAEKAAVPKRAITSYEDQKKESTAE
jgi:hypothetical protein